MLFPGCVEKPASCVEKAARSRGWVGSSRGDLARRCGGAVDSPRI